MEVYQDQGFVLVGDLAFLSYSFDDIILLVQVEQRKRNAREPEVKLLGYKEEEEEEKGEELERILEDVDNYDPSSDDFKDDDDDYQGSAGLLIVKSGVQRSLDDFLNNEINEQQQDQHQESSSSGKHHSDQVFLTQPKVIYLNYTLEGEIEVPKTMADMLEEL
ncbi:hypothetical protein Hanom_Chr17g01573161 [Helianthus anomalus]